jgi:hypothetical protein
MFQPVEHVKNADALTKTDRYSLKNKRFTYFVPLFYPDPVLCQIRL